MPNAFSQLDTSFPAMDGKPTEEKLRAIQDYLYQLLEQLRYTLNNIGPDNFNESEVNGWAGETIVKPIHAEITDVEQGLITYIDVTAEGIELNVRKDYAAEWAETESGVAKKYYVLDAVKVTASDESVRFFKCTTNHTAASTNKPGSGADWQTYWDEVDAADIAYSRFDMTADAIRTEVGRAGGAESAIDQKADAIIAQVSDGNGNYTVVNLKSDGLHIGNAQGTTTIDGSCITAGTVTATEIDANYVYAGEISADQITTGKLQAADVELMDSFTAKAKNSGVEYNCGQIGGVVYHSGGQYIPLIEFVSHDGNHFIEIGDEEIRLSCRDTNTNHSIDFVIGPDEITITKRNPSPHTYNLLQLLDQI